MAVNIKRGPRAQPLSCKMQEILLTQDATTLFFISFSDPAGFPALNHRLDVTQVEVPTVHLTDSAAVHHRHHEQFFLLASKKGSQRMIVLHAIAIPAEEKTSPV